MGDRREFLKETGILAGAVPLLSRFRTTPHGIAANPGATPGGNTNLLGFKRHWLWKGDGRGDWSVHRAEIQYLPWGDGTVPYYSVKGDGIKVFGVAQTDNGQVTMVGSLDSGDTQEKPVTAFSRDGGRTWSKFERIEGGEGRPIVLTYLGKGNLTFQTDTFGEKPSMQYFSTDYGQTWPERQPLQYPPNLEFYYTEGNALVDRDHEGNAVRIAQAGGSFKRESRGQHRP